MLLLSIDSLLLIFITLSLGIFTCFILEKIFRIPIQTDLLGIFLLGLIASTFYSIVFPALAFFSRHPRDRSGHPEGLPGRLAGFPGIYDRMLQLFFACSVVYYIA
jgi:hypothetical protein